MYIIYGTQTCKYCDMAKRLLEEKGIEYEYRAIDLVPEHFESLKGFLPGVRTVPQIFEAVGVVGDLRFSLHIGGYEELKESLK